MVCAVAGAVNSGTEKAGSSAIVESKARRIYSGTRTFSSHVTTLVLVMLVQSSIAGMKNGAVVAAYGRKRRVGHPGPKPVQAYRVQSW
jgi:hypothetical protein